MARKKSLSNEKKYEIADVMAASLPHLRAVSRNAAFGVILNAQLRINGKQTSLKMAFSEEDAIHITNLVLKRVQGGQVIEVSM